MPKVRDRAYWRELKRRQRRRKLQEVNRASTVCQYKLGAEHTCGAVLRDVIDRLGRHHVVCDACTRREAGICRDCPRPVSGAVGRALRCAACRVRQTEAARQRWLTENIARVRTRMRNYARDIRAGRRQKGERRPLGRRAA